MVLDVSPDQSTGRFHATLSHDLYGVKGLRLRQYVAHGVGDAATPYYIVQFDGDVLVPEVVTNTGISNAIYLPMRCRQGQRSLTLCATQWGFPT